MGDHSKIEWTRGDDGSLGATWNPVTGCTRVSEGCRNCYMARVLPRHGQDPWTVVLHPDRLDAPLHWRKPRRIFVNSLSDLFHEDVPDEFIADIFSVMARCQQHTFQVLTKRPARMREFCSREAHWWGNKADIASKPYYNKPLPNVWLGVSCEDKKTLQRMDELRKTPAVIRFVSLEPLLENLGTIDLTDIDWVIAGGESGPGARPMHPDWARSLRDQCQAASVPFFFKQWGEYQPICDYYDDQLRDDALDAPHRLITKQGSEWVVGGYGERHDGQPPPGTWIMHKVGKKTAGRMLDGRTWDEFPKGGE